MTRIHQFHPSISYGDAITDEMLSIQRIIRGWGLRSEIYALHIDPKMRQQTRHYRKMARDFSDKDVLLMHYSIGSEVFDNIEELPGRKVLMYHNITPPEFFSDFNVRYYASTDWGRRELKNLVGKVELALADSAFSCHELDETGFEKTGVLPIILDFSRYDAAVPDRRLMSAYEDGKTNVIFVGRVSPNKKQEDIIKAFHVYQRFINPESRLILVGSHKGLESYRGALLQLIDRLGVKDVILTGHVTFEELVAYYRLANVFLVLSEHEGFCVPLLEAMHFDVPIIAYNATAVPDTLGDAGVLVNKKDYLMIAEAINLLVKKEDFRAGIISGQRRRLNDFASEKLEEVLRAHLGGFLGTARA